MIDVVKELRQRGKRLLCLPIASMGCSLIVQVRAIRTEEMRRQGVLRLLGAETVAMAQAEQAAELDAQAQANDARAAGESPEEARARVTAAEQSRARDWFARLAEDPDFAAQTYQTLEAFAMTAVEGLGLALDGVMPGVLPVGTQPAEVCLDLAAEEAGGPVYLRPARFVGDDVLPVPDGAIPISDLTEGERLMLGMLIMQAVLPIAEVRPFRPRSGDGG